MYNLKYQWFHIWRFTYCFCHVYCGWRWEQLAVSLSLSLSLQSYSGTQACSILLDPVLEVFSWFLCIWYKEDGACRIPGEVLGADFGSGQCYLSHIPLAMMQARGPHIVVSGLGSYISLLLR